MNSTRQRAPSSLCALYALAVAACVSMQKIPQPAPPAAAPPPPPLEASYDWHGLLIVPFGSVLKEIPFTLHEVLLFRAASRDASRAAQSDEGDCYAIEQTPPRFVARIPSEYTLCFRHDRLSRVQATVNVPQSEAGQIYSDACGLWQRTGAPTTGAPTPPALTPAVAEAGAPGACDGRDGAVVYAGRLERETDQADAALTVILDAVVQP